MPSFYRIQLEEWLHQISVSGGRLLDVGGSQNPVSGRLMACHASEVIVLDLPSPHEIKKAPDVVWDLNEPFPNIPPYAEMGAPFETVFCLEVTEYLWNPVVAMQNLAKWLAPGGRLYISFPFVYPMHKPVGCDFLRYTEEGARILLEKAGLEVREIRPRVARIPGALKAFWSSDGMKHRHDETVPHTGYLIIAKKP